MRSQASLITAMQIKCSRKINRWLHLSRLLSLFVGKRAAIFEHSPRAVSRRDLRTTSDGPSRSSSGRISLAVHRVEQAERDLANQPARTIAPPVLPQSLVKIVHWYLHPYRDPSAVS
ncbi:hypothetical protein BSLG_003731 [Batrachochytrium salamandrivorans]|nr:hypothetical protein BSLG_008670 [Batrachochytrium salamandrivorans]KAJ1341710.1 hypothetical protein BSLG_003731 [Batrachochytrium salamandrivorans]